MHVTQIICSVAPIVTLLVALVILKLKAWLSTLLALIVAVVLSAILFADVLPFTRIPNLMCGGFLFELSPI